MELTDLLSIDAWMDFEKKIHTETGLDCNIFNPDGYRITEFKEWVNRLCPVIKDNDKGQSYICAIAHMNLATQAKQQKNTVIEECDAGLVKLVVPVFYDDYFLGAFGACGLVMDDGIADTFMINKTIGLDEEEIEKLSDDIQSISSADLKTIGGNIEKKINRIILQAKRASA